MTTFDSNYYDCDYFSSIQGKEYRRPNGSMDRWGYRNPDGYWDGAYPIAKSWIDIFGLKICEANTDYSRVLDFGAGRGQFIWALRQLGVETWGFDFSQWAIDNRYKECQEGWMICWDATKQWPYGDRSFDLTLGLDIMEHIYQEDLDFVISQMYRVSKKWVFLQIGTTPANGYILKKGENIPIELEVNAVAGHVTVCNKEWWINKLTREGWRFRDDLVTSFIGKVDNRIIDNWIKNAIIILERSS